MTILGAKQRGPSTISAPAGTPTAVLAAETEPRLGQSPQLMFSVWRSRKGPTHSLPQGDARPHQNRLINTAESITR